MNANHTRQRSGIPGLLRWALGLAMLAALAAGLQACTHSQAAPESTFVLLDGSKKTTADFKGKVVLVNFWATWCPPCLEEMPSMERLNEVLAGDDFVMLAVNTEANGRSVVPAFLEKTPYTFPILYDNKGVVQKRYGVFKFPESFFVNKDGTVAEKIIGPLDWSSLKTITYFKSLIKG